MIKVKVVYGDEGIYVIPIELEQALKDAESAIDSCEPLSEAWYAACADLNYRFEPYNVEDKLEEIDFLVENLDFLGA